MLKITMKAPERAEELALAQRTLGKESPEAVLEQRRRESRYQTRGPGGTARTYSPASSCGRN